MRFSKGKVAIGTVSVLGLLSTNAWAHWCDDMWISAYNIVVRPDSDTSPKELYVQNNMGYQLPDFKLTATSSSGGAITLTAPTTLKVANQLFPGEKGTWKITGGSPAKIEDITFSVKFGGNKDGAWTKQDACYPLSGAGPVMVVKNSGDLYPRTPTGIDEAKAPASPCVGIVALGRTLQYPVIADFEDTNTGLDKLLQFYCAGRGSWGTDDAVTKSCCKDTSSTSCPGTKPSSVGAVSDYVHLWAATELAIRKSALGTRLPVLRARLKCGVADGDMGFAGIAVLVLGYLGEDSDAKSFLQGKVTAGGDLGTIAKAALYLMGDATQKADVQAGLKSSSVFVKVACAGALGIVDKDDASITSTIFPEIKWNNPAETAEDGRSMFAAHVLDLAAFHRRGWVAKGLAEGPVTFYGETGEVATGGSSGAGGGLGAGGAIGSGGSAGAVGSGGSSGSAGATGKKDAGNDAPSVAGNGGRSGSGGAGLAGSPGSGGSSSVGGSVGNGGQGSGGTVAQGSGGSPGSGVGGNSTAGSGGTTAGSSGQGGSTVVAASEGSDCKCSLGGRRQVAALWFPAIAGLAFLLVRRRRH